MPFDGGRDRRRPWYVVTQSSSPQTPEFGNTHQRNSYDLALSKIELWEAGAGPMMRGVQRRPRVFAAAPAKLGLSACFLCGCKPSVPRKGGSDLIFLEGEGIWSTSRLSSCRQ